MFVDRIGKLEEEGGAPLYMQLQRVLRSAIERQVLAPDEALPPERDLAEAYNISRVTVRKALDGLVDARLLMRRRGAGTFVASRVEKNFATISSFTEDMLSRGRQPHSEWLARSEGTVTPEEAMALGLGPGSPVYRFTRIRYADGQSMALEYATVPAQALASLNAVDESLYDALGDARPMRVLQRFRATLFTPEQTDLLGIPAGMPGLEIERRGFAADGRTVEFTKSYYRGDAYDFVAELSVAPQ
ncbi:GntR family transcriptional regulator [Stakelama sediminis]|uniref:GntR family transcriptional regulator n=1 Tax=Stakelama sediminis TaxID=463200 RepID=A0A840YXQ7_9SPHN|nr:GntR family transcriptional regulator [Stakelama sediminis]MBB5718443.1 GntR family transcriptional regulator [Stakelama sediminis]